MLLTLASVFSRILGFYWILLPLAWTLLNVTTPSLDFSRIFEKRGSWKKQAEVSIETEAEKEAEIGAEIEAETEVGVEVETEAEAKTEVEVEVEAAKKVDTEGEEEEEAKASIEGEEDGVTAVAAVDQDQVVEFSLLLILSGPAWMRGDTGKRWNIQKEGDT